MLTTIHTAYAQSDAFGKFIFLMLTVLSIVNCIMIAYKAYLSWRLKQARQIALLQVKNMKPEHFFAPLKQLDQQTGLVNPFKSIHNVIKKTSLSLLQKNKNLQKGEGSTFLSSSDVDQIAAEIEMRVIAERKVYEKYMFLLPLAVSLGPLLGLLGTVWGISVTFNQLPNSASALSNDAILSGLAMALGTTVFGIVVAIPALVAQYFFKSFSEAFSSEMEQFSSDLLQSVETQYRAVDVQ